MWLLLPILVPIQRTVGLLLALSGCLGIVGLPQDFQFWYRCLREGWKACTTARATPAPLEATMLALLLLGILLLALPASLWLRLLRPPRLVLEHLDDGWRVTNSGEADALNIAADPIRSYDVTATIERIQRIAVGQSDYLEFRGALLAGRSRNAGPLLEAVNKGAEGGPGPLTARRMERYLEARTNVVVPVRLTYSDPSGNRFESRCKMHWDTISNSGYASHVWSGPLSLWRSLRV